MWRAMQGNAVRIWGSCTRLRSRQRAAQYNRSQYPAPRSHACFRTQVQALPRCAMLRLLCREEEAKRKDYQVVNTEECVWGLDEEWDAQVGGRLWFGGLVWAVCGSNGSRA